MSLLVLFSIVATAFTINYSVLQLEVLTNNLQGIAEHVSAEISDLVSLCSLSARHQLVFKKLEVPETVRLEAYRISIIHSEDLLKVVAQPLSSSTPYGVALLPWSMEGNIKAFNGTDPGINDSRISPRASVSSLPENVIVWCLRKGAQTTFGLGLMEG